MRKVLTLVLAALCPVLIAQQLMNNESVIKLTKAGFSEDVIVTSINRSPGAYDTSVDGLIALKTAKVGDKVIQAMVAKGAEPTPAPPRSNGLRSASRELRGCLGTNLSDPRPRSKAQGLPAIAKPRCPVGRSSRPVDGDE